MCPKINLSLLVVILVIISVLATGLGVFGVMYSSVLNQQTAYYQSIGATTQSFMLAGTERLLANLYEAALSVYYSEPLITSCAMPNSSYNPERIIRLFDALSTDPSRQLESMGFLMRAPDTMSGKVSWEIAYGFGCPDYIYAYADSSIYPTFLGYCATENATISWSNAAYNGTDWGLKPQEYDLLVADPEVGTTIHLPIFALLDRLTLTVEYAIGCSPKGQIVYGAVFAEQSLAQLDQSLATVTEQGIVAFIVETNTGYLVSASIANQTQELNETTGAAQRMLALEAPSSEIRAIYNAGTGSVGQWWVTSTNVSSGDIAWTLVCGIPRASFAATLQQIELTSILVCFALVAGVTMGSAIVTYCFISRPLRNISQRLKEPDGTQLLTNSRIDEIAQLEESIAG